MRSPNPTQGRQRKRQGGASSNPGASTNSNASVVPSDASLPSDELRAQNVVDEFFQPVKV